MSGWTRLARFVSSVVREASPGATGSPAASTGSRISQSALTCRRPYRQSKAIPMNSEAAYVSRTGHRNAPEIRSPRGVESRSAPESRRAGAIRLALIILGVVLLLLWPDVRFSTVAVVVVVELLLFAGIDALAGRENARSNGPPE